MNLFKKLKMLVCILMMVSVVAFSGCLAGLEMNSDAKEYLRNNIITRQSDNEITHRFVDWIGEEWWRVDFLVFNHSTGLKTHYFCRFNEETQKIVWTDSTYLNDIEYNSSWWIKESAKDLKFDLEISWISSEIVKKGKDVVIRYIITNENEDDDAMFLHIEYQVDKGVRKYYETNYLNATEVEHGSITVDTSGLSIGYHTVHFIVDYYFGYNKKKVENSIEFGVME